MLSSAEQSRIVDAVRQVEQASHGEVVVSFSPRSDKYHVAIWRSAVFFAVLTGTLALGARLTLEDWPPAFLSNDYVVLGLMIVAGLVGALLMPYLPVLQRLFVTRPEMRSAAENAAFKSFVTNEVFNTEDRTGILLYFSAFEREVVLLADSGITSVVPDDTWLTITENVCEDMKSRPAVDAIEAAVQQCGDVLSLAIAAGAELNRNELGDEVRHSGGDHHDS